MTPPRPILWECLFASLLLCCSTPAPPAGPDLSDDGPGEPDPLTPAERALVGTLSPLPAVPPDPTNAKADDARAARLGQRLFFDKGYSGPLTVGDDGMNGGLGAVGEAGKVSCESCHLASTWFIDSRSRPGTVSLGANWGRRNSTSIVNAAFYQWFNSDGGGDSMWTSMRTSEGAGSLNSSRLQIAHHIYNKYRDEYNAVFTPPLDPALDPAAPDAARFPPKGRPKSRPDDPDGPWEGMKPADQEAVNRIFVNFGKAMAAYMRLLVSRDAPFDRFVAGERAAVGPAAVRGLKLFIGKAGCIGCHSGPFLSDNKFHNLGVPQEGPRVPMTDDGRFAAVPGVLNNPFSTRSAFSDNPNTGKLEGLSQKEEDKGRFRTSTLRQIAETAPYMHTGNFPTLESVIELYDQGGGKSGFSGTKDPLMRPLNLSMEEKADLVAFLKSLTGQPVPAALRQDTSAR